MADDNESLFDVRPGDSWRTWWEHITRIASMIIFLAVWLVVSVFAGVAFGRFIKVGTGERRASR